MVLASKHRDRLSGFSFLQECPWKLWIEQVDKSLTTRHSGRSSPVEFVIGYVPLLDALPLPPMQWR